MSSFESLAKRYCRNVVMTHELMNDVYNNDDSEDLMQSTLGDVAHYIKNGEVIDVPEYDLADEFMNLLIMHVAFRNVRGNLYKLLQHSYDSSFKAEMVKIYEAGGNNTVNANSSIDVSSIDAELERDVFETSNEYKERLDKMKPIVIGEATVLADTYESNTDIVYLNIGFYKLKNIEMPKETVYFLQKATKIMNNASGMNARGKITVKVTMRNERICVDLSTIKFVSNCGEYSLSYCCFDTGNVACNASYTWLPAGKCLPIKQTYNIDTKELTFSVEVNQIYKDFLKNSLPTFVCNMDRDIAKAMCYDQKMYNLLFYFNNKLNLEKYRITDDNGKIRAEIYIGKKIKDELKKKREVFQNKADSFWEKKDYSGGLRYVCDVWIPQDPTSAHAYNLKGVCMSFLSYHNSERLEAFLKAIELEDTDEIYYSNAATEFAFMGKINEAIEYFNEAEKRGYSDYDNWRAALLANAYGLKQQYGKAIQYYNIAIEKSEKGYSELHEYYCHRGLAYYHLNEKDKALSDFKEAARLNPDNKTAKEKIKELEPKKGFFSFF